MTITADAKTKVYGEAAPELTYQITSGALVGTDVLTGSLSRAVGENIGTYAISSTLANSNYEITFVSDDLTITANPITITADANFKFIGTADPSLTYQITSGALVGTDVLSGSLSRETGEVPGIYAISSTLTNSNYTITFIPADFRITIVGDCDGNGIISSDEIAGDADCDGVITAPEICGDINGDGIINNNELCGDVNGDKTINNSEIGGDTNGDKSISGEIAGDKDANGTIVAPEICGDIDLDGIINNSEICGDINGDMSITGTEVAGDINGNLMIEAPEVCGDVNGDGAINNTEKLGDENGNFTLEAPDVLVPIIITNSTATVKTKICPEDDISCSNFDNTLAYQWQLEGTNIAGQTESTYSVPELSDGVYTLKVRKASNGCENISTNLDVQVYPEVANPIIIEKKLPGSIAVLLVDNKQHLYFEYLWSYADGSNLPLSLANNRQFLTLPASYMKGSYMVTVSDANGCILNPATKTVSLFKNMASLIYPTLSNGNFTMDLTGEQIGLVYVRIYNQMGTMLKTFQFEKFSFGESIPINAQDLESGSYLIEISINDFKEIHKIFIR